MMQWEKLLASGRFDPAKKPQTSVESNRTAFEIDYDRIIFSAPFRNLQDKTQVFPLPEHDFVHTRLTHSLEVSSVGRSLGKSAGEFLIQKYPQLAAMGISREDIGSIVAAAALTHDIGNPPFGHAGEEAISDYFRHHAEGKMWKDLVSEAEWTDLCNFEGNAQGFRMLVSQNNGLKLSYATLAAFTKYPRPALVQTKDPNRRSQKKFGFFHDQLQDYATLATHLGLEKANEDCYLRHPLAYLVEAADDICYSIIDLEDGCTLGLVSFGQVLELIIPILGDRFQSDKLKKHETQAQKLAILRAMTIGKLIEECVIAFMEHEENMLTGDFDRSLTEVIAASAALERIGKLSVEKLYRSKPVLEKEAAGFQVLEGLLQIFGAALYHKCYAPENFSGKDKSILRLLPEELLIHISTHSIFDNPYNLLRKLIDFLSSMSDKYALSLYRRVKGIALPGS
jgi:dGTPase